MSPEERHHIASAYERGMAVLAEEQARRDDGGTVRAPSDAPVEMPLTAPRLPRITVREGEHMPVSDARHPLRSRTVEQLRATANALCERRGIVALVDHTRELGWFALVGDELVHRGSPSQADMLRGLIDWLEGAA